MQSRSTRGGLELLVWQGLLLASALLVSECKREVAKKDTAGASAASAKAQRASPSTPLDPMAAVPELGSASAGDSAEPVAIELPAPPKPPELRDEEERTDAAKILASYGFPSHESLTVLCGWRDFNPGGTTWVVDLFSSPLPVAKLRHSYEQRLGQQGLKDDTWSIPASGAVTRQLRLVAADELKKYPRCQVPMSADAKTLVVARRAK